jgi:threonine aldolase
MRQAGILAAAGLIALEEMPDRLHEDHANARLLAEALAKIDGVTIDPAMVETNIIIFQLTGNRSAPELAAQLKKRGILVSAFGPQAIRLVTHHDVDCAACLVVIDAFSEINSVF